MKTFLALILCVLVAVAPAKPAVMVRFHTDGLGFPVYPHAVSYTVFGLNVAYVAGGDVPRVAAWYRNHSGRPWSTDATEETGRVRSTNLSFTDASGLHRLHIWGDGGGTVSIGETLDLTPAGEAAASAAGQRLRGATDPLGVPLYPHRIVDRAAVVTAAGRGLVSYASLDAFDTVFRWFNARLSNRYTSSYSVDDARTKMRTFHGGRVSVSITRRRKDGDFTVIGVQLTD